MTLAIIEMGTFEGNAILILYYVLKVLSNFERHSFFRFQMGHDSRNKFETQE